MLSRSDVVSMRRLAEEDRRNGCYSEPLVVIALCDEIDAMRPVVEVACDWRATFGGLEESGMLADAVDAYRQRQEGDDAG